MSSFKKQRKVGSLLRRYDGNRDDPAGWSERSLCEDGLRMTQDVNPPGKEMAKYRGPNRSALA